MYPETDVPPVNTPDPSSIKIPKLITEFKEEYEKIGLSAQAAEIISRSEEKWMFDQFLEEFPSVEPQFIFSVVYLYPKDIRSRLGLDPSKIGEEEFRQAIGAFAEGRIPKEAVEEVLAAYCRGEKIEDAVKKFRMMSEEEVKEAVERIISELRKSGAELKEGLVMGRSMAVLRGKADGKVIAKIVREKILR